MLRVHEKMRGSLRGYCYFFLINRNYTTSFFITNNKLKDVIQEGPRKLFHPRKNRKDKHLYHPNLRLIFPFDFCSCLWPHYPECVWSLLISVLYPHKACSLQNGTLPSNFTLARRLVHHISQEKMMSSILGNIQWEDPENNWIYKTWYPNGLTSSYLVVGEVGKSQTGYSGSQVRK